MKKLDKFLNENKINIPYKKIKKNEKQRLAVVCFAENEENEYLLLNRYKEPFKGFLVPPGGKVEKNETIEQAVKREFLEETTFELENIEFQVLTSETGPENYNWILFIFTAKIKKQSLKTCNEGILGWYKKSQLKNLKLSSIDKLTLPYIMDKNKYFIELNYDQEKNPTILNIQKIN